MHHVALGLPADATNAEKAAYARFIYSIGTVLPCKQCRATFATQLDHLPPVEGYMDSADRLFEWTVALHNRVNMELSNYKARHLTVDEARQGLLNPPAASPSAWPRWPRCLHC